MSATFVAAFEVGAGVALGVGAVALVALGASVALLRWLAR